MEFLRLCWVQRDRAIAVAFVIVGSLLLLLGWLGVSDKVFPAEQIPYLASGGLGGVFCLGVAGVLWLSADLHDEWRKLHRIDQELAELVAVERVAAAGPPAAVPDETLQPARRRTPKPTAAGS